MKFRLVHQSASPASASPYRIFDDQGRAVVSLEKFLDLQRIRGLSLRSLRAYAYDLLHFARWWWQSADWPLSDLNESKVLDYVRDQLDHPRPPTPATINHRLTVLRCLYRFHYHSEIPKGQHNLDHPYIRRGPLGYGRPRAALAGFRLRQPRQVVVPLAPEEVARFWRSFHTFRDLSLVALMLFNGLRSCETLELKLEDLRLSEAQLCVRGKGDKQRVLPLPSETIQALQTYLRLERPLTNSAQVFVSLKGPHRGHPMSPAGLRSLFRHHRRQSQVPRANPHRFRHTFGADMVRAGISLPALMTLMGHAHIRTTLRYVQLSPQDVWREYAQAVQQRVRLVWDVEELP